MATKLLTTKNRTLCGNICGYDSHPSQRQFEIILVSGLIREVLTSKKKTYFLVRISDLWTWRYTEPTVKFSVGPTFFQIQHTPHTVRIIMVKINQCNIITNNKIIQNILQKLRNTLWYRLANETHLTIFWETIILYTNNIYVINKINKWYQHRATQLPAHGKFQRIVKICAKKSAQAGGQVRFFLNQY